MDKPLAPQKLMFIMFIKMLKLIVPVALLSLFAVSETIAATSIGGSFIGRGADDTLAPTASAGVIPQTQWNNIADDGSTFKGTTGTLKDSAGNFTGVRIIYDCNDSW